MLQIDRSTYVVSVRGPVHSERTGELAAHLGRLRADRVIVDLLDVPSLDPAAIDVLRDAEERTALTVVAEPRLLGFAPFRFRSALSDAVAELPAV